MTRSTLSSSQISESATQKIESYHAEVIDRVTQAIGSHAIVVVGMAQNPHVKRARRTLEAAGLAFEYVEYGSYLSAWKERLAIKMWSGWPTFPQVFVDGTLIGGADALAKGLEDGSVRLKLDARSAAAE